MASDNRRASSEAIALINRLGFDAIDTGSLAESWRFEPEAAAYTRVYLADPSTPDQDLMEAAGGSTSEADLRSALSDGTRVDVAQRIF